MAFTKTGEGRFAFGAMWASLTPDKRLALRPARLLG
jgi:hypothetical protein